MTYRKRDSRVVLICPLYWLLSPLLRCIKLPLSPGSLPDPHTITSNVNSSRLHRLTEPIKEASSCCIIPTHIPAIYRLRGRGRAAAVLLLEPNFQLLEGLATVGDLVLNRFVHLRVAANGVSMCKWGGGGETRNMYDSSRVLRLSLVLKDWIPAKCRLTPCPHNLPICPPLEQNWLFPRSLAVRKGADCLCTLVIVGCKHIREALGADAIEEVFAV